MVIHQANHARILHLRETAGALNQSITSNLTLLTDVRKDILTTPATAFPENQRNVPYTELLDYAKRISKYTVPPTFRPPIPVAHPPDTSQPQPTEPPSTNGASAEKPIQTQNAGSPHEQTQGEGIGVSSLGQEEVQWLDPLKQIPFVPWPSEDVIRQGGLAQIQVMLDQGIDPSSVSAGAEEIKVETSEDPTTVDGPGDRVLDAIPDDMNRETSSRVLQVEKKEEKPKVFGGLDLYDPEEEA